MSTTLAATADLTAPRSGGARPTGAVPAKAPWWLAAIVLSVLIGFATRGTVLTTSIADPAHAVHGATALTWSLLLVVQAWLAQDRRR